MAWDIHSFDPQSASPDEWASYHAFRRLRHEEVDPDDPLENDHTAETFLKHEDPEWDTRRFIAADPKRPAELQGWLEIGFTREGALTHETNAHMAWVNLEVLGPHRRQGVGSRLLSKAAEVAREQKRSLLIGGGHEPDGLAFIKVLGAQVALTWRESRLHFDQVDWAMIESWAKEGPIRSSQTALRFFTNHVDEPLLEAYCALAEEVSNQEPRGDLDVGDERWTPATMKERVDNFVATGGTLLHAVTQEGDAALSGHTVMGYFPEEKTMIHQYGTGVREPYRGRGLGKWLKAAMLLRVREQYPDVTVVVTGNATTNEAMLSINERLGFQRYREGQEVQIRLEVLEAFLKGRERVPHSSEAR